MNATDYYNAGVEAYQAGQVGKAYAYFEKSNALLPYRSDTRSNLSLSRKVLVERFGEGTLDSASGPIERVVERVSGLEIAALQGLILLIAALLIRKGYRASRNLKKTIRHPASWAGLTCIILAGALALLSWSQSRAPLAYALESEAIRSGPGLQFVEIGRTIAGAQLRLIEPGKTAGKPEEPWAQVRFAPESLGWVRAASILPL